MMLLEDLNKIKKDFETLRNCTWSGNNYTDYSKKVKNVMRSFRGGKTAEEKRQALAIRNGLNPEKDITEICRVKL